MYNKYHLSEHWNWNIHIGRAVQPIWLLLLLLITRMSAKSRSLSQVGEKLTYPLRERWKKKKKENSSTILISNCLTSSYPHLSHAHRLLWDAAVRKVSSKDFWVLCGSFQRYMQGQNCSHINIKRTFDFFTHICSQIYGGVSPKPIWPGMNHHSDGKWSVFPYILLF